jgi:hypothetical protein
MFGLESSDWAYRCSLSLISVLMALVLGTLRIPFELGTFRRALELLTFGKDELRFLAFGWPL